MLSVCDVRSSCFGVLFETYGFLLHSQMNSWLGALSTPLESVMDASLLRFVYDGNQEKLHQNISAKASDFTAISFH